MELRLDRLPLDAIVVPEGFAMLPWTPALINHHAAVKFVSFSQEIDTHIFPCLGEKDGCKHLMREIVNRGNFVPESTWLAVRHNEFNSDLQACGTVQGLLASPREGGDSEFGSAPAVSQLGDR